MVKTRPGCTKCSSRTKAHPLPPRSRSVCSADVRKPRGTTRSGSLALWSNRNTTVSRTTVGEHGPDVERIGHGQRQGELPSRESSCAGTITLQTLHAVTVATGARSRTPKAPVLTLAEHSLTVAGGRVSTVRLHLSRKGRVLLAQAHNHTLRARMTIVAHDPTGATHTSQTNVTIHASKRRR